MADVIAKLKVDAKEYDGGLAKAKKSLDQFTKQNMSLNGVMAQGMTALTKFAGGFAAAELAAKSFNAIIMQGSQTTGDFVRNGLGAMNDTLGVLASSIATLDFGPLLNGLSDVYTKALNARESLDSLNDTLRGMGLIASDAREAVAEYREVMADSNATDEEKAAALKKANDAIKDYGTVINTARKETDAWVSSTLQATGGFSFETTADEVKKLVVEYAKLTKAEKEEARAAAATAAESLTDLKKRQKEVSRSEFTSMGITQSIHRGGSKEDQNKIAKEIETYEGGNEELLRQNVLFERYSDEQLDNMANTIQTINGYSTQALRMQRQLNTAQNAGASTSTKSTAPKSTAKAAEPIKSSMSIQDFDIPDLSQTIFDRAIPSMDELNKLAKYWTDQMNKATSQDQFLAAENALKKIEHDMEIQPIALRFGFSMPRAEMQNMLNEKYDDLTVKVKADLEADKKALSGTNSLEENGKGVQKSFEAASRAISSAGSALQSVDNEGLNIAGTIMQAIADVALGFAMALASPTAAATGPWGWIAAAAAGAATMVATIATIKSATSGSYAQGGIVPGAYNGGLDSTYVYASPGEVILNRAQQENILSQLDDGSSSGNVTFVLNGEKLEGCLNHYGRRSGKGKLVFA